MNQTAQHISPNPALDFAQSILEETNNALELIEILNKISEDTDEATTNDRISANTILSDRVFGKAPKQVFPNPDPNPDPAPAPEDNDAEPAPYSIRGAIRESPSAVPHNGPESPRLVTQIDDSLNESLGPAPSAPQLGGAGMKPARSSDAPQTPEPFEPYSIHYIIQQHILAITNNGQTLRDTLLKIARAEDDPKVKPYHRRRAVTLLLDRALGTDPSRVLNGVCPDCRQKWTAHPDSPAHPERGPDPTKVEEEPFDEEVWAGIIAELKQKEEAGILTPDPDTPKMDYSIYLSATDEEVAPYAEAEAAAFRAKNALRLERRKQWPEIEERRRKKLAQTYPSHSEDDDQEPPDT